MNRNQGTTIGAVLMAALLFRGAGSGIPGAAPASGATAAAPRATQEARSSEGPWIASCQYWAPARLDEQKNTPGSRASADEAQGACEASTSSWGVPVDATIRIATIVATVPDPIHSSFSPQFDRAMDALIDAGEDNGYLTSYYWLPWENEAQKLKNSMEGMAAAAPPSQVHEPGLIIFKHSFNDQDNDINNGFHTPLYLFLVGETATSGIDGEQMQKALRYQRELAATGVNVVRSLKSADQLSIIGPIFSGSASSFREAIDTELTTDPKIRSVQARGTTSTRWATDALNGILPAKGLAKGRASRPPVGKIEYFSFANDTVFDQTSLTGLIGNAGVPGNRIAILIEDGTTLGQAALLDLRKRNSLPAFIRFPREISMLRNASEQETRSEAKAGSSDTPPSPYLHFSLKDSNAYDSVPHLSHEMTPLSQEAQVMAIARQLERSRAEYVVISATNVLDQIFLAQRLHFEVPDARLVFDGGDVLFERERDNRPFIGSLTVGPYPLFLLTSENNVGSGGRAFSDWTTEAYYNAASYTFADSPARLRLADYRNPFNSSGAAAAPPLWITAIGSDGYYPLGIISPTSSSIGAILPRLPVDDEAGGDNRPGGQARSGLLPFHPSQLWHFLCLFVFFLCVAHSLLMQVSDFWSPLTRDLAIDENDQPWRRSMCIHIGAAMLFSLSVVVGWPLIASMPLIRPDLLDWIACGGVLAAGLSVLVTTLRRTWPYRRMPHSRARRSDAAFYNRFNVLALVTAVALPLLWILICSTGLFSVRGSHAGLFFAWRCLRPASGVCPLIPIVLLLLSWYVWSVFQTLRLRFSECHRPRLPGRIIGGAAYPLYVSDDDLAGCESHRSGCLYRNISCLLITREAVRRFVRARFSTAHSTLQAAGAGSDALAARQDRINRHIDRGLTAFYFAAFIGTMFLPFTQSMDRILWNAHHLPTPYEFLIKALFFPLLIIALTGWLRMILIWAALQRSLLQRLENLPVRFAFDRLTGAGWMAMFRESGLREQWRDMARSTESMRQFLNQPGLPPALITQLKVPSERLDLEVRALLHHIGGQQPEDQTIVTSAVANLCTDTADLPCLPCRTDLGLMHALEKSYAQFAEVLLQHLLLPFWNCQRTGMVQSQEPDPDADTALPEPAARHEAKTPAKNAPDPPEIIRTAEEFVAIRYVSLIRAVLVNLRYLMIFISAAFVLAIVAWNSYDFEPHQLVNWLFTVLLFALGIGIIRVFAQMHRDPILSRITHTTPNQLGLDFYIRVASFGAVPVLTWFAYNFPQIGGTVFSFLRPGVDLMK